MAAWGRISNGVVDHARATLVALIALTLFFASFLLRLEVDTSFLSFVRPETRTLVETIEDDFAEGAYLTLIFESRTDRSLLEPDLLHQQLRVMQEIEASHPVTTFSLVGGIDNGLRRVKGRSLLEYDDYATVAESILGLAGGRTVRDLHKVSKHFLSDPQAIEFYTNLRIAQAVGALPAPGAPDSRYRVPYVRAIKALIRTDPGDSRDARRERLADIRSQVASMSNDELDLHVLSDDLVAYDIDRGTQRSAFLLGLMVLVVDVICVLALFRSAREVAIVFTILVASSIWTFGLAGMLGVDLSFLHLLAFPILLGTGIDDTLIFGRRLEEERRRGLPLVEAIRATYAAVGNAVFLTSFTTFVAFLTTALTAAADVFASFFLLVSASMLIVLVVTLLLEGALRVWLAGGEAEAAWTDGPARTSWLSGSSAILSRWSHHLTRLGPRPALGLCGVLVLLSILSATRLESEMARRDLLQASMPTFRANEAMQKYFGDFRVGYVLFSGEVENAALIVGMERLEQRLSDVDAIEQVLGSANVDSVVGLLAKMGIDIEPGMNVRAALDEIGSSRRTADYAIDMSFDEALDYVARKRGERYDGLLIRFFVPGEAGTNSLDAVAAIEREIADLGLDALPGVDVRIGGGDIIYPLESVYYAEIMIRSFLLSLLANGVVLLIAWRRVRSTLLALLPMVLATVLVVGSMPIFGVSLNPLNLGIGAIIVGLGVDYPIHILERCAEERRLRGRSRAEAARVAVDEMGPHMLAGMLTTAVGFCASCVLLLPMSTSFGLLTGAAIVLVYLATLFLLPPLMVGRAAKGDSD